MMSPSGKTKEPTKQTTTLKNNLYKSIELIEEKTQSGKRRLF